MNQNNVNTLLYAIGWTLAIYFASLKQPLYAFIGAFLALSCQLCLNYSQKFKYFWPEFYLVIYAFFIGLAAETLFINFNVVDYGSHSFFPPLWVLCLYMLFATTFNLSFEVIKTNALTASIVALFAPLAYFAASKLGICTFPSGGWIATLVLIFAWQAIMTLLRTLNEKLLAINETIDQKEKSSSLTALLYDGDCPICSREINLLKSSPGKNRFNFVDISSPSYDPIKYQNISRDEAMKKITIIEGDGPIKSGVEAFFDIYSKAKWRGLAMALKAPVFSSLASLFYSLFAKYRLKITGKSY